MMMMMMMMTIMMWTILCSYIMLFICYVYFQIKCVITQRLCMLSTLLSAHNVLRPCRIFCIAVTTYVTIHSWVISYYSVTGMMSNDPNCCRVRVNQPSWVSGINSSSLCSGLRFRSWQMDWPSWLRVLVVFFLVSLGK